MSGPPDRFDAVVVGSGFGGAIAACRLAQAGRHVAILERGARYDPVGHPFPRELDDDWLWAFQGGPFDIRPFREMVTVTAAGYGGGSLLYSNVHLRVPEEGFGRGWPAGWTRTSLDPYYDLVAHALALTPVAEDQPAGLPARTHRMREAAVATGREADFFLPPLAVSFGPPDKEFTNAAGRSQYGCSHCGNCSLGCNQGAKNSLDLTYLARAEDAGADVHTSCEVVAIAPESTGTAGTGYLVRYRDHGAEEDREIHAEHVVLAAGAVGTTELLLRCREAGLLTGLSDRLGERYSGNGDLLAFAVGTDRPYEPTVGPAITAAVRWAAGPAPEDPWFVLQDGNVPPRFANLVIAALRASDRVDDGVADGLPHDEEEWFDRFRRWHEEPDEADPHRAAVFLAMGRDRADGRFVLADDPSHSLELDWDVAANQPLYRLEQGLIDEFAAALGADPVSSPAWRYFRQAVSVHSLGGAVMADSPASGVVDPAGEVYGHPGLFVMDGAALPAATGVNPSHTIAAVAERHVEALIRRTDPGWRAPEWSAVTPYPDPLPRTPSAGNPPPRRVRTGVRTRVGLHGTLALVAGGGLLRVDTPEDDALTLVAASLRDLLAGRGEPVSLDGTLRLGGAWPAQDVRVDTGLVVPGRTTRWTLPCRAGDVVRVLAGTSHGRMVRLTLHDGPRPTFPALAFGVLTLDLLPALGATRLVARLSGRST